MDLPDDKPRFPAAPFAKGNPGRPRGVPNKKTVEIRELAHRFMTNRRYLAALADRLRAGKAPHMEVLLAHYAWGKPKERIEVTGLDLSALEVLIVEVRNGAGAASGNGHSATPPLEIDVTPSNGEGT